MRRIKTEASTYLLDDDEGTFTRYPGDGGSEWRVNTLYGDGEPLELAESIGDIEIGDRLTIWHYQDGRETWRVTTPVVSVEDVA